MKLRVAFIALAIVAAAAGGWFAGHTHSPRSSTSVSERTAHLYRCAMHPHITADHPGDCTICGMQLVPVYDGEKSSAPADEHTIKLGAASVQVLNVESAPVRRAPLRRALHVAGQIEDDDSAHRQLSAYVDGRIDKLYINTVGAVVTAGQPLAAFYSRDLLVARGEYALALKQPPSSEREMSLAGSRAKLRRMGLSAAQIKTLPQQTGDTVEMLAPISGIVIERKVYEGSYVKEGDVLFEIADFDRMWFVGELYERDLAWVKVGQTVEISTPTVPGRVYTAPISFIDPNLVAETRTARLRVILENPRIGDGALHRHELLHKIYADGFIKIELPETLLVPRSAVLSAGEALVYVVKEEGVFEARPVVLGRVGDADYEVLSGLAEGERVVTNGNLMIDAQAQLVSSHEQPKTPTPATPAAQPFSDAQEDAARELVAKFDALSQALSEDDLAKFSTQAAALSEAVNTAATAFAEDAELQRLLQPMRSVAAISTAPDLAMARKLYHPLAEAFAALAKHLRGSASEFAQLKIFRCPMTADAFPGAPAQARWVQLSGPVRNPYLGRKMLDCGAEETR